ncbi:MAG: peptidylprolyl isomerase [Bacteroidales bacterium]|nr:peptidylprolyl isomerase [Bacteroidales bacterium]MDD4216257.1 peptidylprolyl isomerase [Bacteroidales bacterium]MDY0142391.1 peptidylprolyl isomerase [Bacteroidales bacterium]
MDIDIKGKDYVKIDYTGSLDDGSVFDSSEGREPLAFILDVGMLIPGLEADVKLAKTGDKRKVVIAPENAYGEVNQEAVQDVPKTQFPEDLKLEVGMALQAQTEQGPIPANIKEIKEESVIVDFNHPLAGQKLTFDYEVLERRPATEDDLKAIMGN